MTLLSAPYPALYSFGNDPELRHHINELVRVEGLSPIRHGMIWIMMNLYYNPVCTSSNRGSGHWNHLISYTRTMRWICEYREVAELFNQGEKHESIEFMRTGILQLQEGLDFIRGTPSELQQTYKLERQGWRLFYNSLEKVSQALRAGEAWALSVQTAAKKIVSECLIN